MFEYQIGGKKYYQQPLVLGQIQQLLRVLEGIKIDSASPLGIISALGERIHEAIAIVLIPEGQPIKEKDIKAIAEEIAFEMTTEEIMQVIEDFFVCNPVALVLQRLNKVIQGITQQMQLTNSSASLQQETLQKKMQSSGE